MTLALLPYSIILFCLSFVSPAQADAVKLPELGNSTSSIVSLQQEYQLGQYWLRAFRQQASLLDDPLLYTYVHDLIQTLAYYSPLEEKYFDLLLVDNTSFNAFAVPGHIIGVHSGLFLYANTEDQLASVLTHEIAHLSQRHYARSVEQRRQQNMLSLAGLLGSLLLIAAGGGDAGIAALTATQAAAISSQLRYSRIHEQEADRVGIQTLAAAGMNPEAAAHMFQHLLILTRYRTDLKDFEFLMTHPIADSRVADALNLAKPYARKIDKDGFDFHLMKARVYLTYSKNASQAEDFFRKNIEQVKYPNAMRYGLALALLAQDKTTEAATIIETLHGDSPQQLAYQLAYLQLLFQQKQFDRAFSQGQLYLKLSPNNYAISMYLAELYAKQHRYNDAVIILRNLSQSQWPNTPDVWLQLAEMEGMAGNIANVHLARAEYFVQIGAFLQAQRQLSYAKPTFKDDVMASSRIEVRMQQIEQLKQNNPF